MLSLGFLVSKTRRSSLLKCSASLGGKRSKSVLPFITAIKAGDFVFVTEGTVNASHGYVMTQTATIDIGTTDITWTQFSGAGQIIDGNGINKNGQELSLDLKQNGGLVFENNQIALKLDDSAITGILSVADGGTGISAIGGNKFQMNI